MFSTLEGRDVKTSEIKRWHVEDNGWRDIGYHFVIELDGSIHKGRAVGTSGAHIVGENHNIGICYVGGMDKDMQSSKIPGQMHNALPWKISLRISEKSILTLWSMVIEILQIRIVHPLTQDRIQ